MWAKFDCSVQTLAKHYSSNHAHAVPGDYVGELIALCNTLGVEPLVLS